MNTVVILAAGMGIRLSPIVGIRPKGLLKIGDYPLLGRSINMLKKHGIKIINKLSGVGENLQDHFEVPVVATTYPGYGYYKQDKGIRKYINGLQYLLFNSGPVMSNGCESVAYYNPINYNDSSSIQLFCVMPVSYRHLTLPTKA